MSAWLEHLLPRSLFGRIVLLLTTGLLGAQLISAAIHVSERRKLLVDTIASELAQQTVAVYRTINSHPASDRHRLATSLSRQRMELEVMAMPSPAPINDMDAVQAPSSLMIELAQRLSQLLEPGVGFQMTKSQVAGDFQYDLSLELSDGQWLRIKGAPPSTVVAQTEHALFVVAFMLVVIVVLVIVVARSTVRPLTRLANAAHGVADDLKHPPLPEEGPSEVQEAARAFNTMQKRIREGIEERERFLAAVSHDLKTPVTRLRLRAEMLTDSRLRNDIGRDLDEMQQLIEDSLEFLRGQSIEESSQPIDLVALVESVADDFGLIEEVQVDVPDSLRFKGKPVALQRALRNLVDNAIKYGQRASITLSHNHGEVIIMVDDEGHGLPADKLEAVFEPFFRVEESRCRDTGGFGLGLAIVRQVAQIHGGSVHLANRPEGGLRATLILPKQQDGLV